MDNPRIVLLAEDSAIVTMRVKSLLEGEGYHVITATDGVRAVERAHKHRPDLIILDVEMPRLNGISACREIKADPKTAKIPILMHTSHEDPLTLRDCFDAGCDGYVVKGAADSKFLRKVEIKLLP